MREANLRGLDLNLLVLLDYLLDHRNVTQAAAAANLSQPAMSRALGRLRGALGDPILARGADGLIPTPRALALQPALRRVLADVRQLVSADLFSPSAWTGQIVVAATDHQTIMLLPDLVSRLSREAPRLDIKVVPFIPATLEELRNGRVDLGFGIDEQPLLSGLRREPLYLDRFVSLVRQGHPAGDDWTLDRFVDLDHVLVTILGDGRGALDDNLAQLGRSRRIALRLPHFYAAMTVVARSDLVVTLPRSIAFRFKEELGLRALDPPLDRPPFTVVAIWPEVLDAEPGMTWLRSVVRDEAARMANVSPL